MARIYVGSFAKYNNGSIAGAWLDLEDYSNRNEFYEACAELHDDEEDCEYMFQDWEDIPDAFIGESHIDEEFWDYMNYPADEDAKAAYCACFGEWDADRFNERYRGEFRSWKDMAESFADEMGYLSDVPDHLQYYFDYEKYANGIRCSGDMVEDNLHFFWNN